MTTATLQTRLVAATFLAAAFAASSARAAPMCSGISTTPVAFGTYSPVNATPTDSMGTVSYFCPGALSPMISINAGSSASFSPRTMLSGASALNYNLYVDAARTTIWGDGTSGTATVAGTVSTKPVTNDIFGRIFPLQSVAAGSYSDSLIVTINF